MADFSVDELEAARKALTSSYRKIDKVRATLLQKQPPPKSQVTLATRNLEALRIALSLIEDELAKSNKDVDAISDSTGQEKSQRLAAFEDAYQEVADSMTTIPVELEKLKAEGKEKTVRYKELFGQKLMNSQIAALYKRHGIPK